MASEIHEKTRLCLKSIDELVTGECHRFFVDKYQRGYKWDSEQVRELLDDINNFSIEKGFYCLQPIIVKYRYAEKAWELIDGQQRLTTIYLILSYLKSQHFHIKYKTRVSSEKFLECIHEIGISKEMNWQGFLDQNKDYDNVDNYHFFNAYQTIMAWFEEDRKDFVDKICKHTKVIWYDVTSDSDKSDQEDSIKIFSRVNAGKIKLTDAELIKALLLNGSTVNVNNYTAMVDRAKEWDDIEKTLQDDEFWYFINKSANTDKLPNRIEFLLGLVADDIFIEIKKKFSKDSLYYIFYCFYFCNYSVP